MATTPGYIVNFASSLWRWTVSRMLFLVERLNADHGLQRFMSESLELLQRVSSLKLSHLSFVVFFIIAFVLILIIVLWRLRVSRYNEFWGLKKSVHFWTSFQTSAQPQYCSACSQLICGFWIFRNTGWECTVCGRTAHIRCLAACDKFDCKCPSQTEPLRHQLVQGNLPSDSVCGVCGIICASPFGLHGLRCLWCGRTVHEECLKHLPEICDLGTFHRLVLPPSIVRLSVVSSRLHHSLTESFGSLFQTKKTSDEKTSNDFSASAQRYLKSMRAQLKEGMSQVQVAMATGLLEGLKEVTADVRRINDLIRQEFRRRLRRELHQQQIEVNDKLNTTSKAAAAAQIEPTLSDQTIQSEGGNNRAETQKKNYYTRGSNFSDDYSYDHIDNGKIIKGKPADDQIKTSDNSNLTNPPVPKKVGYLSDSPHVPSVPSTCANFASKADDSKFINHFVSNSLRRGNEIVTSMNLSQSAQMREARLKYRQLKLRRLEKKRLTAVAGALAAERDRYSDRLFELAKLMPAKADVWEIQLQTKTDQQTLKDDDQLESSSETSDHFQHVGAKTSSFSPMSRNKLIKFASAENKQLTGRRYPTQRDQTNRCFHENGRWSPENDSEHLTVPYVLHDRRPLLVFISSRSGGQIGSQLIKQFYKVLNPMQVVDIQSDGGPQRALSTFKKLAEIDRLRILVCGGDGTAGWVMKEVLEMYGPPSKCHVPVGILPLGTGNDLSRVLGWGDSFDGDVPRYLSRVETSQTRLLDQWNIRIMTEDHNEIVSASFNNYMDIGVAARIALKFHQLREAHPELFQSRLGNKFLYGEMGVREWVTEKTIDLSRLKLWCDGLPVVLPERKLEGLIVVNIPSFSGGVNLWSGDDNEFVSTDFRRYKHLISDVTHCGETARQLLPTKKKKRRRFGMKEGREVCLLKSNELQKKLRLNTSDREFLHRQNVDRTKPDVQLDNSTDQSSQNSFPQLIHRSKKSRQLTCSDPSTNNQISIDYKLHHQNNLFPSDPNKISKESNEEDKIYNSNKVDLKSLPMTLQVAPGPQNFEQLKSDRDRKLAGKGRKNSYSVADFRSPSHHHRSKANENIIISSWNGDANSDKDTHMNSIKEKHEIKCINPNLLRRWQKQSMRDELIEVVALRSLFHLGQIQVGLAEPIRVCQGRQIRIEVPIEVPLQIDGEPRIIPAQTVIEITYKGKSFVLSPVRSHDDAVLLTVTEVLDAAVRDTILTAYQRNCLIWELNKRL